MIVGATLFDRPGLNFLKHTGPEVEEVAKTFRQRYNEQAAALFTARTATENQFRANSGRSNWIHLATHGFFAPKIVTAGFDRVPGSPMHVAAPGRMGVPRILFEPGLFSGMTLAGASEANEPDQDDGILWSFEIASRDLRHVDLAIMSACETADGVVAPGEGILGPQRAFHMAGAKNVMATLWPVNDLVARQIMNRVYQNVHEKKMSHAEAMREAQLAMLNAGRKALKNEKDSNFPDAPKRYSLPRTWAPFVFSTGN